MLSSVLTILVVGVLAVGIIYIRVKGIEKKNLRDLKQEEDEAAAEYWDAALDDIARITSEVVFHSPTLEKVK